MKNNAGRRKVKNQVYKKWWLLATAVVIVTVIVIAIVSGGNDDNINADASPFATENQQQTHTKSKIDSISFNVKNVRNDTTGRWRIATIAENIDMKDYALDYYNKYFMSDKEIHAIVNFNYMTTTKISVMGNLLDVTVYEYVSKEEHDAKLLFSGRRLKEYFVNMNNGEIEEI